MTVEIRPAEPGDLPAVRAVARRAWYAVHEPIVGAENVEQFLEEYYSHDALVERFNADGPFLLADEEAVVGFAVAGPAEEPSVFVLDASTSTRTGGVRVSGADSCGGSSVVPKTPAASGFVLM